jgi:uncharacterized membrane protein YgdD (TMEM256/DUF423 family)
MTSRETFIVAALLGFIAVSLGAFGAHILKPMLIETGRLEVYQTAVAYQFYHVFALLATGILMLSNQSKKLNSAALCFFVGIILFSGSLYTICFVHITWMAMLTPVGGVFFLAGWLLLLLGVIRTK